MAQALEAGFSLVWCKLPTANSVTRYHLNVVFVFLREIKGLRIAEGMGRRMYPNPRTWKRTEFGLLL